MKLLLLNLEQNKIEKNHCLNVIYNISFLFPPDFGTILDKLFH